MPKPKVTYANAKMGRSIKSDIAAFVAGNWANTKAVIGGSS
jgi:hypothetical protein